MRKAAAHAGYGHRSYLNRRLQHGRPMGPRGSSNLQCSRRGPRSSLGVWRRPPRDRRPVEASTPAGPGSHFHGCASHGGGVSLLQVCSTARWQHLLFFTTTSCPFRSFLSSTLLFLAGPTVLTLFSVALSAAYSPKSFFLFQRGTAARFVCCTPRAIPTTHSAPHPPYTPNRNDDNEPLRARQSRTYAVLLDQSHHGRFLI